MNKGENRSPVGGKVFKTFRGRQTGLGTVGMSCALNRRPALPDHLAILIAAGATAFVAYSLGPAWRMPVY